MSEKKESLWKSMLKAAGYATLAIVLLVGYAFILAFAELFLGSVGVVLGAFLSIFAVILYFERL